MKNISSCPVCYSKNISKHHDVKDYFLTQENFSIWKCQDCGLQFTNPRPEDEDLGKYYDSPDYLSHDTHSAGFMGKLYNFLRQFNIKRKYKIVNAFSQPGKILDIGCGTGELLHYFQKHNWDCVGVEPNASARNFAKKNYRLKVEEEQSIRTMDTKSMDIISMWHVLEHVPDVNDRMQEIKRILKDDGHLVIALPNPTSWDANFYGAYWAGLDVPRHLFHFSPKAFEKLANQQDLQIINTLPLKLDAFYVSLLSERYKKNQLPLIKAFFNGIKSNTAAAKTGNYSSMIYILTKKDR